MLRVVSQIEPELQRTAMPGRGLRHGDAEPHPQLAVPAGRRASIAGAPTGLASESLQDTAWMAAAAGVFPLRSYLEFGALPGAVPCARLHTRHVLWEWGLGDLRDPAELIVSELLTNAVTASHTTGRYLPVRLWLLSDGSRIEIQVWDSNPKPPRPAPAADTDETGRGLLLVEAVSAAWDWRFADGGKIVWAVLDAGSAEDRPGRNQEDGGHRPGDHEGAEAKLSRREAR